MAGVARVGINLQSYHGHVVVASVEDVSPASAVVNAQDVVVAINGVAMIDSFNPHMAQRAIALALGSTTSSGRCEPVRLTLARLVKADLDSPKGVDVDFGSTDMRAAAPDRESISCYGVAQSL